MYIGISAYNHESSAALVNNKGNLLNYYREESLSRIKGDNSFPKRALNRILETNNLRYEQIESVAFYERPLTAFLTTIKTAALNMPKSLPLIVHQCRNFDKSSISCYLDISKLYPGLEKKLLYLDHHLSHTLTSLSYSSIQKDICSIVIDGFGDRSTTSISKINNKFDIKEIWSCDYPHSLGLYYSAITDFLGFQINEGEYKVMGLSAFGDSKSNEAKKVADLIHWDRKNKKIVLKMEYFSFHVSPINSYSEKLVDLLGEPRNPFISLSPEDKSFQFYANIARGAQDAIVKILCDIFEFAHSLTGSKIFCFSGGVAMNSAALDKVASLQFVNKIVIPPSPGDAGSSIGAAYYAYLKTSSKVVEDIPKPTLFPSIFNSSKQIKLTNKIITKDFRQITNTFDQTIEKVSKLICEGNIIGFVTKNAETGPRALGNRSLICDGKNQDAVKLLNTVIKNRSPFRPTAPCMKYEVAQKYYELKEELLDSYLSMSATCYCKKDNISLNFPTTHVDGSVRLQIVEKGNIIYELLNSLEKFNIEILANSSLNLSGDPTCFDLIDSIMVSARTPLKYLVTDIGLLEYIDC